MEQFDPFDPAFRRSPFELYRRYRECEPVHWGRPSIPVQPGTWYVFRHEDVLAGLKDQRFGRETERSLELQAAMASNPDYAEIWMWLGQTMLFRDPPEHTRLRGLVNPFFGVNRLASMEPLLQHAAQGLIGSFRELGEIDIVPAYATPLPITLILELLGIPDVDKEFVSKHTLNLTRVMDFVASEEVIAHGAIGARELVAMLQQELAHKRSNPADDIFSRLAVDCEQENITESEVIAMALVLLTGGHETTSLLIASGLHALLSDPDQLALAHEDASVDKTMVDELLRFCSPVQVVSRVALEDMNWCGKEIRRGDDVMFMIGSANRDGEVYADAEQLDLRRKAPRTLPFGSGIHHCIGAQLTLMEGRVGFRSLLQQFPRLRLKSPAFELDDRFGFRGPAQLPVLLS